MSNFLIKNLDFVEISDLAAGLFFDRERTSYTCLFCGQRFEDGQVFSVDKKLLLADRAAQHHVAHVHGGAFQALLGLGKPHTGLSELQQALFSQMHQGQSDREIARALGGKSPSTVRNHRFQMRKRKKEAKIFLALMALLDQTSRDADAFLTFNADIRAQDDRAVVTTAEAAAIEKKYFTTEDGQLRLNNFPRKQKSKLVILNRIIERFDREKHYTEKEVDRILKAFYFDQTTLRRYLIDYGFLDRKRDGSAYWRR
ncbi:MAG: DUF2087 domain-containing protein [Myxococcota bacterium]|nr:DUF2087 domain-containing protein [Myxococcota bacterium]